MENFNTARVFFAPKNSKSVVYQIFKTLTDEEKIDIELFLQQANVILYVCNSIGKINIKAFDDYIKSAYCHWIKTFGKYRKLKSSIHWTLGHVIQFIYMNSGYSLAEMSENSVEAIIKSYRYI